MEARKGKNMTQDVAMDAVTGDVNMFGVMMVAMGDAGGMVSGSIHTTAATIRPAMQVLKTPNLVSSVFFMCLPDKVRTSSLVGLLANKAKRQGQVHVSARQHRCHSRVQLSSQVMRGKGHLGVGCGSFLTACACLCAGACIW